MSRHMSTRNISSKSMHAFYSNLANRQTDRQTRANAFTSSFVGGNKIYKAWLAKCPGALTNVKTRGERDEFLKYFKIYWCQW